MIKLLSYDGCGWVNTIYIGVAFQNLITLPQREQHWPCNDTYVDTNILPNWYAVSPSSPMAFSGHLVNLGL